MDAEKVLQKLIEHGHVSEELINSLEGTPSADTILVVNALHGLLCKYPHSNVDISKNDGSWCTFYTIDDWSKGDKQTWLNTTIKLKNKLDLSNAMLLKLIGHLSRILAMIEDERERVILDLVYKDNPIEAIEELAQIEAS